MSDRVFCQQVVAKIRALRSESHAIACKLARARGEPLPEPRAIELPSLRNISAANAAATLVELRDWLAKEVELVAALSVQLALTPAPHFVIATRGGTTTIERLAPAPPRRDQHAL